MGGPSCLGFGRARGPQQGQADGGGQQLSPEAVRNSVVNERRRLIFQQLTKEPVLKMKRIEFVGGDAPMLRLSFAKKQAADMTVDVRFFDDAARESWRRGLALALHKGSAVGQWQRDWDG